ncbi:Cyclin-dependent kinase 7 [Fasciola gigantica]|uniref:[RNA-polymerase]-subunit kinase n=1 Tax=Fasciola gigantica TaxID=46835 RepID=A0A504YIH5_FASGI|nr:Cyclin-dependent kinase 7 [Fasciola gigantica]
MGTQAHSPNSSFEVTIKATVCSTGGYIGSPEEKAAIMAAESLFILVVDLTSAWQGFYIAHGRMAKNHSKAMDERPVFNLGSVKDVHENTLSCDDIADYIDAIEDICMVSATWGQLVRKPQVETPKSDMGPKPTIPSSVVNEFGSKGTKPIGVLVLLSRSGAISFWGVNTPLLTASSLFLLRVDYKYAPTRRRCGVPAPGRAVYIKLCDLDASNADADWQILWSTSLCPISSDVHWEFHGLNISANGVFITFLEQPVNYLDAARQLKLARLLPQVSVRNSRFDPTPTIQSVRFLSFWSDSRLLELVFNPKLPVHRKIDGLLALAQRWTSASDTPSPLVQRCVDELGFSISAPTLPESWLDQPLTMLHVYRFVISLMTGDTDTDTAAHATRWLSLMDCLLQQRHLDRCFRTFLNNQVTRQATDCLLVVRMATVLTEFWKCFGQSDENSEIGYRCFIESLPRTVEQASKLARQLYVHRFKLPENDITTELQPCYVKAGPRWVLADGMNLSAVREIKALKELDHPNVLTVMDVFSQDRCICLVFEFMAADLEALVHDCTVVLIPSHIKALSLQLLRGVEYLHANWLLHRDLKPNNLFLSSQGKVKIGDFGLTRQFATSPSRPMTHQVATRWYRAPELFYGCTQYGVGIDLWAVGCIIAEFLLRVPLFPGDCDLTQLAKIYDITGTPDDDMWPDVRRLVNYVNFEPKAGIPFSKIFTAAGSDLIELLETLLSLDPDLRGTAQSALASPYFKNKPYPTPDDQLPQPKVNRTVAGLLHKHDHQRDLLNPLDPGLARPATTMAALSNSLDDTSHTPISASRVLRHRKNPPETDLASSVKPEPTVAKRLRF